MRRRALDRAGGTLSDDIARVAALRGKSAAAYATAYAAMDRDRRRLRVDEVRSIFVLSSDPGREQMVFDTLPTRSREALRALPVARSAVKYEGLLTKIRDEPALIAAVENEGRDPLRRAALNHYGPNHPQAQL